MSGIVGIMHSDGKPVEHDLLEGLTAAMADRGPDGRRTWCDGPVGLGFAKLATTKEAEREEQPLSLDGETWIVADARIDARVELVGQLESAGREGVRGATDAELVLHAYGAWGEGAAVHLLGDFSFAIWDRRRGRLFCARDHFGVKPFYYAEWPGGLVFGNSLEALRRHPAVSSELQELAVADFLLFESNLDPEATTFADIRRLPPAHALSCSRQRRVVRRYWQLPSERRPPAEPAEGWCERFSSLLRTAVEDRLRTERVALLMSGGLDSTFVAALAQGIYVARGRNEAVRCLTLGYDRLIPDQEAAYAAQVATHLRVPHRYQPVDDYKTAERWGEIPVPPQPGNHVLDAMSYDVDRILAAESRVVLTGLGGDPLLRPTTGYLLSEIGRLRLDRAARYLIGSLLRSGNLPPLGLHTWWLRRRHRRHWRAGYPSWLAPEFAARLDLESRWRWFQLERGPETLHPRRPEAWKSFWDVGWANAFEQFDALVRIGPVERRHPFFDVRLVECLMDLPPAPWCIDKCLLRQAARNVLPDAVRRRPKTPLAASPKHPLARPERQLWRDLVRRVPEIAGYVCPQRVLEELRNPSVDAAQSGSPVHRPLNLAYWLTGDGLV